jgi:hypothetical protein
MLYYKRAAILYASLTSLSAGLGAVPELGVPS